MSSNHRTTRRDEVVDECTNCGQETVYRCIRFGHERLCEGCYVRTMEAMP